MEERVASSGFFFLKRSMSISGKITRFGSSMRMWMDFRWKSWGLANGAHRDGPSALCSARSLQAVYLWIFEPRKAQPHARTRVWEECGIDVADAQAWAGFQNDSGFSKREPPIV